MRAQTRDAVLRAGGERFRPSIRQRSRGEPESRGSSFPQLWRAVQVFGPTSPSTV